MLSSSKPPRAGQAPMLLSHQHQSPTPCLGGLRVCEPWPSHRFSGPPPPQRSSRHAALQAHMQRQRDIKLASSSYGSTSTPHTARRPSANKHSIVTPPLPAQVLSPVRPISAAATHQIDTQKHIPRSLPASAKYQSPSPHPFRARLPLAPAGRLHTSFALPLHCTWLAPNIMKREVLPKHDAFLTRSDDTVRRPVSGRGVLPTTEQPLQHAPVLPRSMK